MGLFDFLFRRKPYPKSKTKQVLLPGGGLIFPEEAPCKVPEVHFDWKRRGMPCPVCVANSYKAEKKARESAARVSHGKYQDERLEMITDRVTEKVIQRLRDEGLI